MLGSIAGPTGCRRRPGPWPARSARALTLETPGDAVDGAQHLGENGEKPSVFWTTNGALEVVVDRAVDRRLRAGGEDRHEHDEREADHQRRGGDRRAPRLADRVLARQAPGHARHALERPPDDRGQRAHEARATAARRRRTSARAPRPMKETPALSDSGCRTGRRTSARRRPRQHARRRSRAAARRAARVGTAPSRIASTGGTRVARSAGAKLGDHADDRCRRAARRSPCAAR